MRVNMHTKEFNAIKEAEYEKGRQKEINDRSASWCDILVGLQALALVVWIVYLGFSQ